MTRETRRLLKALADMEWFSNVGQPIDDLTVATVKTWREAARACGRKLSQVAAIECQNLLTERLHKDFIKAYCNWNELVVPLNRIVKPMVRKHVRRIAKQYKMPENFEFSVYWDISGACMELEYGKFIPPNYFAERAKWYLAGHFPCGWEGGLPPKGRLVVF
ncbi:MAG TPA: hypothetical protein PKD86_04605 [Gemmatales bacterium]|nr:hypothetical protein [Gemmatales bacterium]